MNKLPDFLIHKEEFHNSSSVRKTNTAFIDKTIQKLARFVQMSYLQQHLSRRNSFFTKIAIRTRLLGFLYFILLISILKTISMEMIVGLVIMGMHLLFGTDFLKVYKRIILFTFLFGFLISLPAALNIINKGDVLWPVIRLSKSYDYWIYHVPQVIGFTAEGLKGTCLLTLRVFNSISISFFIMHTTPFNDLIKGLKIFRVPDSLLMIFTLSYLYIFILSNSVAESYLAMKSRIIGHMDNREIQQLVAGRLSHIFKMSRFRFEKTFQAMLSRGYTGEVAFYQEDKLALPDYLILCAALISGLLFFIY